MPGSQEHGFHHYGVPFLALLVAAAVIKRINPAALRFCFRVFLEFELFRLIQF
jgi:hypothetical protein